MSRRFKVSSFLLICVLCVSLSCTAFAGDRNALVFQSDFGLRDGAVASMKGVAFGVDPDLRMFDVTNLIEPYDIWQAAYMLNQTAPYWPEGTVFVSVVDPGVGTDRKSVVLKTSTGHYFVTPDNGTLTLVAESMGIAEIREIDESLHRRKESEKSYTFHGRDVYALTGAKLAAGATPFEKVGPKLPDKVVSIPYQRAKMEEDRVLGTIPILDIQYGNVWTNIDRELFGKLGVKLDEKARVKIYHGDKLVYDEVVPYVRSFGYVEEGMPLLYINSLNNLSIALNMDSFSARNKVYSGPEWKFEVSKAE